MHVGLACSSDIESALDLATILYDAGASITLYLSRARASRLVTDSQRVEECFHEHRLIPEACKVRLISYPRIRDPRSLDIVRSVTQLMHEDGIDILHIIIGPVELWLAAMALMVNDLPVVTTFSEPKPNIGGNRPAWLEVAINQLAAWGSDIVVVNGRSQVKLMQKMYRVGDKPISYVPLCPRVTAIRWSIQEHAEEPGTVLFLGGARRHKGLEYLIRAQPHINLQLPDARIIIASHGADLERCLAMIQEPDRFEIHNGFVPGEVMAALYQRTCLVALPYITAGTSGVLLDAYGFGKPVVASDVGILPEYVEDGHTGVLVPPTDEERLAQAIVQLLADDDLRHRMGENAKRWVMELQQSIARDTLDIYERAFSLVTETARSAGASHPKWR